MSTQMQPVNGHAQPSALAPVAPAPVVETAATAVAARERAAVEARYLVALHRPRNPDNARLRLLARCESPAFAEVAEYAKPVGGGKKATGASIRAMEEIARQWGNIDVQSQVTFDDPDRRNIRVTATDLESNYAASVDVILEKTVERRNPRTGEEIVSSRTNSTGQTVYRIRADEDAFLVKQNAAISKARRECIRAVVPGDLVEEAMQRCADTRRGEVKKDPAAARKRLADAFFSLGVMASQLCEYLGKPSLEGITEAEIEVLRVIYASIKEGDTTWAEVMEEKRPSVSSDKQAEGKGTSALKDKLNAKKPATPDDSSDEAIRAADMKLVEQEGER